MLMRIRANAAKLRRIQKKVLMMSPWECDFLLLHGERRGRGVEKEDENENIKDGHYLLSDYNFRLCKRILEGSNLDLEIFIIKFFGPVASTVIYGRFTS